jgi:hypothetical protein
MNGRLRAPFSEGIVGVSPSIERAVGFETIWRGDTSYGQYALIDKQGKSIVLMHMHWL